MRGFCFPSWIYLLSFLNYLNYSNLCLSSDMSGAGLGCESGWAGAVPKPLLQERFYLLIFWSGHICVIMLISLLLFCLPARFSLFFCCEQTFCNTLAKYALYIQAVNLLFPLVIVSWKEPKRAAGLVVMNLDVSAFSFVSLKKLMYKIIT